MSLRRNGGARVGKAVAAIAAAAAVAGAVPAAASPEPAERLNAAGNATCRHDLFLQSGIGPVAVRRTTCRRAIRALRGWVHAGMPRPGPRGWSCRRRTIGAEAPYTKVRCARGRTRMRFTINP
jgi:hypothetical protein